MLHHGAGLCQLLERKGKGAVDAAGFAEALMRDWATADITPVERAMLSFAVELTRRAEVTVEEVETLRAVGLNDQAVHDLCVIVAYFNFVNRIAGGLGVELEDRFTEDGPHR